MLNNCREAWQRENSEITFSDFHHWLSAQFFVCICARRITGLTYMRICLDTRL